MKEALLILKFTCYSFAACFVMLMAMFYPMTCQLKGSPWWFTGWLIYPVCLIVISTQKMCLNYFHTQFEKYDI